MKLLGLGVLGLFALFGAVAVAVLVFAALEQKSSRFETFDELVASELVERGWVPSGLPKSVRRIEETHDVSSNSARATFAYDPQDVEATRQACKLLVETPRSATFLCPPFDGQPFLLVLRADGSGRWELVDTV